MAGKPWTTKDDDVLRRSYKRLPIGKVALKVGRTESSVYQRARKLGLHDARDMEEIQRRKVRIRELISQGLSDSEVASVLGMDRRGLAEMRCTMGVPANGRSERYRRRVAQKTKEQCKAAGVRNLAEIRGKRYAEFCESLGWPGLSVRAAQIAETLYRLGPMTRKQICRAVDMPWRGSRKSLSTNRVPGGSYMAELQRAGIVVRLESAITHKGRGKHEDLYMIGLGIEPRRKEDGKDHNDNSGSDKDDQQNE